MEKEKLINEIDQITDSIGTHIKRLKGNNHKLHKMDIDLMIEKTKLLYDQLIRLDGLSIPFETNIEEALEPKTEEKIVEEPIEEEDLIEEAIDEPLKDEIPEGMLNPEKPEVETVAQVTEKEKYVEEIQEQLEPKELEDKRSTETQEEQSSPEEERPVAEEKTDTQNIKEEDIEVKSTIDLFSTSAEPTLSDKFKSDEQITIADKITKEHINELREAIGINEKFLFINELFNGDMGRYNKIIDELDQLTTLEGVETYLLELKIQSQWSDDKLAFNKLSELLHRKFLS